MLSYVVYGTAVLAFITQEYLVRDWSNAKYAITITTQEPARTGGEFNRSTVAYVRSRHETKVAFMSHAQCLHRLHG